MKRYSSSLGAAATIALGAAMAANGQYVALAGFQATGVLDAHFGNNGKSVLAFPGTATGMALDSKGRIVVVGIASGPQIALARYQNGGQAIDTTFGNNGFVMTSIPGGARGNAVAVTAGDTIVVAGRMNGGFGVARFSEAGVQQVPQICHSVTPADWRGEAFALSIASDGRIVAAGANYTNTRFVVARFTADACRDPSFASGLAINSYDTSAGAQQSWQTGKAVAIDGTGRILVAGPVQASGESGAFVSMAVIRFYDNGFIDTTYGSSAIAYAVLDVTRTPTYFADAANSIVIHNGHASVAGNYQGPKLARFNSDGVNTYLTDAVVAPKSLIVSPDDSALLVGGSMGSTKFGLAEFNFNGTPVTSFGNAGVTSVDANCSMANYIVGIANQFLGTTFGVWRTVAAGPSGPNGCL